MPSVWTHGTWTVKPGQEDAFVEAWLTLARTGISELGAEPPTLLRDRERPNVFISFGPFADDEEVERFRSSEAFRTAMATMRELLDTFEPRTLDEVSRGG